MKRCPTCNLTFEEDWLAFCTQDGTTLIEDPPRRADEPAPTILAPPPPPMSGGWQPPSGSPGSEPLPPQPPPAGGWHTPSGNLGPGQFQSPAPPPPPAHLAPPPPGFGIQPGGWQPPPPPTYVQAPKQGMAIASMACGIFTISIGWCCYLGTISGPVALALGIYQLVQIKNKPDEFTGKPFAIVGIATASVYFVLLAIFILIYGVALFAGGMR